MNDSASKASLKIESDYAWRTRKSAELSDEARRYLPSGVAQVSRYTKPHGLQATPPVRAGGTSMVGSTSITSVDMELCYQVRVIQQEGPASGQTNQQHNCARGWRILCRS